MSSPSPTSSESPSPTSSTLQLAPVGGESKRKTQQQEHTASLIMSHLEEYLNKHVERFLLVAKILIIVFTIVAIVLTVVCSMMESKMANMTNLEREGMHFALNICNILNEILFFAVLALVITVCFLIMFMFRKATFYVITASIKSLRGQQKVNIAMDTITVPEYYVSLTVWMMLYFIVVGCALIFMRIFNNIQLLYAVT